MRALSKSKLLAFSQCRRRLWLEVHQPELRSQSEGATQRIVTGNRLGELARRLFDPGGRGELIDAQTAGFQTAFERSRELLASDRPIFEVGFSASGALAFADILLPIAGGAGSSWKLIEVKSTGSLKDYHFNDVAVQAFVASRAGVVLNSIAVAHIDTSWTYPGDGDYRGLLIERDVTAEAMARANDVQTWVDEAQSVLAETSPPDVKRGRHCSDPFECGFVEFCRSREPDPPYPVAWLPRVTSKALKSLIEEDGVRDIRDVPSNLLNPIQQRVKTHTLDDRIYFDEAGARADLRAYVSPAYFLDFETIQFAVPIWAGTHPFQQIPFQFSLHRLVSEQDWTHDDFLDLTGDNPSQALAYALLATCGEGGVIFAYNASFERRVILDLANQFPPVADRLRRIADRLVDLLPVARERFYHPSQKGSWSIKAVLPAIAPDLRYDALEGVQHGGMAQDAYLEAIRSDTSPARREDLKGQLERYCELDTWAMVRLWQFFTGQEPILLPRDTTAR